MLESVGFQALVFEDFLDAFTALIRRVGAPEALTHRALLDAFNNPEGPSVASFTLTRPELRDC